MNASDSFNDPTRLRWTEQGAAHEALWRSERGQLPPRALHLVTDNLSADAAYGLICQGTGLLWRGDFAQARQLLSALTRRFERQQARTPALNPTASAAERAQRFHQTRQARAQQARALGRLLIPLAADYRIPLRRAPDGAAACQHAWGPAHEPSWVALREWLGVQSAYGWHTRGIPIPALGGQTIHPDYGVFAPTRTEYLDLVAQAPLPAAAKAGGATWDIGTGTGVIAAILAHRGLHELLVTDLQAGALRCARHTLHRLAPDAHVTALETAELPAGQAALIVCNPPWLPARATSGLELGVYDTDGRMLADFLRALPSRLLPGGEGWLVLSDLAEHLGLRSREDLLAAIEQAGLRVLGRLDTPPRHARAQAADNPLHDARTRETVSLWRLGGAS